MLTRTNTIILFLGIVLLVGAYYLDGAGSFLLLGMSGIILIYILWISLSAPTLTAEDVWWYNLILHTIDEYEKTIQVAQSEITTCLLNKMKYGNVPTTYKIENVQTIIDGYLSKVIKDGYIILWSKGKIIYVKRTSEGGKILQTKPFKNITR